MENAPLQTRQEAIVGGELAWGRFESVAWLSGGCTATLVHERVLVYAAHCGVDHERAWFVDELELALDAESGAIEVSDTPGYTAAPIDHCVAHEDGGVGSSADIAVCILSYPVENIPVVLPVDGCEEAALRVGVEATLVGFGFDSPDGTGAGKKRFVRTQMTQVTPRLIIGKENAGSCGGDSGGPALVRVGYPPGSEADEAFEWRLAGVLSSGHTDDCGTGFYATVTELVPWLEQASGHDLSPCFEGAVWTPSEECWQPNFDAEGVTLATPLEPARTCRASSSASRSAASCTIAPIDNSFAALWLGCPALLLACWRRRTRGCRL